MPSFPSYRPRRLRRTEALRQLVRETTLEPSQLVLPVFVRSGTGVRQPVASMPGCAQTSVDEMLNLDVGSVVELDRLVAEPLDLIVQGVRVARGEVVVVNDQFAIRISEITGAYS